MCERSPLPVSVKTRLGLENDDEYERVLDLYCRMPLAELIVHPRVQKAPLYGLAAQRVLWRDAGRAPFPVAYNGDIFDLEDMDAGGGLSRHAPCDVGAWPAREPALARMVRAALLQRLLSCSASTTRCLRHMQKRLAACGLPHEGVVVLRQVRFR